MPDGLSVLGDSDQIRLADRERDVFLPDNRRIDADVQSLTDERRYPPWDLSSVRSASSARTTSTGIGSVNCIRWKTSTLSPPYSVSISHFALSDRFIVGLAK